jgi:hypothetical protein
MKFGDIINPKEQFNLFNLSILESFIDKHCKEAEYFNNILLLTPKNNTVFPVIELIKIFNKHKIQYAFTKRENDKIRIKIYDR